MKNNLIKLSVSYITISTILNFLAPPTWASKHGEEMPDINEGRKRYQTLTSSTSFTAIPPTLPPKNNWLNGQIGPRIDKPSQNNKRHLKKSQSVIVLPFNRSFAPINQDNGSQSALQPELQQENRDTEITSHNVRYGIPPTVQITLTEEGKKPKTPKKTSLSLRIPKKNRIKLDPLEPPFRANSPKKIPKSEQIEQISRESSNSTDSWETKPKVLKQRRFSLQSFHPSPSFSNIKLSPRLEEASRQSEVVEKSEVPPSPKVLNHMKEVEQNDIELTYEQGLDYFMGRKGVEQNNELAVHLFQIGTKRGHILSQASLAHCYAKGAGIKRNFQEALRLSMDPAQNGHSPCQYRIAHFSYHGIGVFPDKKEAKEWYIKAAKQGHLLAQVELGEAYLCNFGEPIQNDEQKYENEKQALLWLQKAAEQKNKKAQALLQDLLKIIEDRNEIKSEEKPTNFE